jgi:hypothetical protein
MLHSQMIGAGLLALVRVKETELTPVGPGAASKERKLRTEKDEMGMAQVSVRGTRRVGAPRARGARVERRVRSGRCILVVCLRAFSFRCGDVGFGMGCVEEGRQQVERCVEEIGCLGRE